MQEHVLLVLYLQISLTQLHKYSRSFLPARLDNEQNPFLKLYSLILSSARTDIA